MSRRGSIVDDEQDKAVEDESSSSSYEEDGDDENEDDNEDDNEEVKNRRFKTVKLAFDDIKHKIRNDVIDLRDAGQLKQFADDYKDYLNDTTSEHDNRRTLLHELVEYASDEHFDKYEPLVGLLIKDHPSLLVEPDWVGNTSLYDAVSKKRNKLARFICEKHPEPKIVLGKPCRRDENCLHAAISMSVPPELALFLIERADNSVLCHQDNDGNTPLHSAVEYKRCTEAQLRIVECLAKRCDVAMKKRTKAPACLSPYLYHLRTRTEAEKAEQAAAAAAALTKTAKEKKEATQGNKQNGSIQGGNGLGGKEGEGAKSNPGLAKDVKSMTSFLASSTQVELSFKEKLRKNTLISKSRTMTVNQPSPKEPINPNASPGEFRDAKPAPEQGGHPHVAEDSLLRMEDSKDVNWTEVKTRKPGDPKRTKKESSEKTKGKSRGQKKEKVAGKKVTKKSADAIRNFLMLHCMRTMKREDAEDFLYGQKQGKEIYFDLCDQLSLTISEEQIEKGLAHVEFERILQYVALPNLQIEKKSLPTTRAREKRPVKPDGSGRNDMTVLFEFLRKKNVERIIRLIVDDKDNAAHSDEAIESALRGVKVEIWNWQKFDLCTETIRTAAEDVEEVYLYWSGNNAVLRGWSDEEGLKSLKNLKKVYLNVKQGLETVKRTQDNVTDFCTRMKRLCPGVSVNRHYDYQSQKHEPTSTPSDTGLDQLEHRHRWLICMDEFADLIQGLRSNTESQSHKARSMSYQPITIGLIDDGVDMKEKSLHGRVVGGKSFCPRDMKENLNKSYYVKGGGHGTAMARLICRVCPNAELYILNLEEYSGPNLERQITAESAAKAVRAAIARGVCIISMSWTIEKTDDNKDEIAKLDGAVQAAAKAGILMFCAASDKGATRDTSIPAAGSEKRIFKIGAAKGDMHMWTYAGQLDEIDFIFPGHEVVKERYKEACLESYKALTGSSVATAVAAGLAALVLECVRLAALYCQDLLQQKKDLDSALQPQKGGSGTTQPHRDPKEIEDLRKKQSELLEAIQRAKSVTFEDYDALKTHDRMKEAIQGIGMTRQKYVEVWDVFGHAPAKARGLTREEKLELVCDIATRLKMTKIVGHAR